MQAFSGLGADLDHILDQDDTELFRQFMDNDSFKRWLTDTIFGITYDRPTA